MLLSPADHGDRCGNQFARRTQQRDVGFLPKLCIVLDHHGSGSVFLQRFDTEHESCRGIAGLSSDVDREPSKLPIDRNRAAVRRLTQVSTVADYEGQILEAVSQLGVSLALKGDFRLEGSFTFPDGPPPTPETLVETARKSRPQLGKAVTPMQIGGA